eukprot:4855470-Amphidinium_carterae.2
MVHNDNRKWDDYVRCGAGLFQDATRFNKLKRAGQLSLASEQDECILILDTKKTEVVCSR